MTSLEQASIDLPGTVDDRVIRVSCRNMEDMIENHTLLTNSALGVGLNPNNLITSQDLLDGKVARIMSFVAELIEVSV